MSYTINLTNGTTLVPGGVADGTIDTSHSSLTLIGRNYAGYGAFLNSNFIHHLENFANNNGPANPLKGQLWWDTTNNILKVWSGTSWKISTGATASVGAPGDLSSLGGDLWYDTVNQQLKVYSGTQWITVGPAATVATGNTGAFPALLADTSLGSHIVIQFTINGTIYAIFSKDTFTSSLSGFTTVKAGINFSTTASPSWVLSTQDVNATASTLVQRDGAGSINATTLNATSITTGSLVASTLTSTSFTGNLVGNVAATNISATTVNSQGFNAASGYTGTVLTASQPNITSVGNLTVLNVSGTGGTTNIYGLAKYNGVEIATVGGTVTFSSLNNTPIGNAYPSTGAFTTLQVSTSLTPVANLSVDLGSTSSWFNNIYGTAIHAKYADLAERFAADAEYLPGTVVELGGPNEITKVVEELSERVFGVISTSAAYLMNSSAGDNLTHPPVAMSGRVPVRVVGIINKGDRLVSAGNGLARAGTRDELTPFNVIGRALENKSNFEHGIIEAIVKLNS